MILDAPRQRSSMRRSDKAYLKCAMWVVQVFVRTLVACSVPVHAVVALHKQLFAAQAPAIIGQHTLTVTVDNSRVMCTTIAHCSSQLQMQHEISHIDQPGFDLVATKRHPCGRQRDSLQVKPAAFELDPHCAAHLLQRCQGIRGCNTELRLMVCAFAPSSYTVTAGELSPEEARTASQAPGQ